MKTIKSQYIRVLYSKKKKEEEKQRLSQQQYVYASQRIQIVCVCVYSI